MPKQESEASAHDDVFVTVFVTPHPLPVKRASITPALRIVQQMLAEGDGDGLSADQAGAIEDVADYVQNHLDRVRRSVAAATAKWTPEQRKARSALVSARRRATKTKPTP